MVGRNTRSHVGDIAIAQGKRANFNLFAAGVDPMGRALHVAVNDAKKAERQRKRLYFTRIFGVIIAHHNGGRAYPRARFAHTQAQARPPCERFPCNRPR